MTVPIEPIELIVVDPEQGATYPFNYRWDGGTGLALTLFNAAGGTELPLAPTVDWTATPPEGGAGGEVTLLADPAGFDRLRVRRATAVRQPFIAPETARSFEAALDRVVMAQQEREGDILDAVRQVLNLDGGVVETNPVPAINAETSTGSSGAYASVRAHAAATVAAAAAAAEAAAAAGANGATIGAQGARLTAVEGVAGAALPAAAAPSVIDSFVAVTAPTAAIERAIPAGASSLVIDCIDMRRATTSASGVYLLAELSFDGSSYGVAHGSRVVWDTTAGGVIEAFAFWPLTRPTTAVIRPEDMQRATIRLPLVELPEASGAQRKIYASLACIGTLLRSGEQISRGDGLLYCGALGSSHVRPVKIRLRWSDGDNFVGGVVRVVAETLP